MISMKDAPFSFGPWGETFSILSWLFLDSTVDLLAVPDCGLVPAVHEATIALDWSPSHDRRIPDLPLHPCQNAVWEINCHHWKSCWLGDGTDFAKMISWGFETWCACGPAGLGPFVPPGLGHFQTLTRRSPLGNSKDHELREILDQKPPRFSLSMLPCAQKHALEEVRAAEEGATLEAETERLKVREARWQWFQAALARDQVLLRQVVAAPEKIQAMKHRKQMSWRLVQAKNGEKVVRSYMDKFLHCEIVAKVELAQQKINEYRSFVASWLGWYVCLKLNRGFWLRIGQV